MAFDSDGKPSSGALTLPNGAGVEIYKNWLYVRNPKLWKKGTGYNSPVIAEVQQGDVSIGGFQITAARHKDQSSVFCFVHHVEYTGKGKKKYETHKDYYLAGIGCYGFKSDVEWLKENHPDLYAKIAPKYWNDKVYMMAISHHCGGEDDGKWGFSFYSKKEGEKEIRVDCKQPDLDDLWVGVTPETAKAFFIWLKKVAPKNYFAKIDQGGALRYNQGDAYCRVCLAVI